MGSSSIHLSRNHHYQRPLDRNFLLLITNLTPQLRSHSYQSLNYAWYIKHDLPKWITRRLAIIYRRAARWNSTNTRYGYSRAKVDFRASRDGVKQEFQPSKMVCGPVAVSEIRKLGTSDEITTLMMWMEQSVLKEDEKIEKDNGQRGPDYPIPVEECRRTFPKTLGIFLKCDRCGEIILQRNFYGRWLSRKSRRSFEVKMRNMCSVGFLRGNCKKGVINIPWQGLMVRGD